MSLQILPKTQLKAASILAALIFASVLQEGCATSSSGQKIEKGPDASENIAADKAENDKQSEAEDRDPLEGFNRAMYTFNDKVDNYIAEPITVAYKWITPNFVQKGISNFFTNTKSINVVLNDVFQGKFSQSAQDTGRFLVNTTIGVAGLFDVASYMGLSLHDEDFDQTLAVWGVPKGAYLVLPFLGPSTTRGIPGSVVDTAANPITYVGLPAQVLAMLNARANAEGALKFIDEAALDPYVFTRESFLQWRDYLSTDGTAKPASENDQFVDELEEELDDKPNSAKPSAAAPESQPKAQNINKAAGDVDAAPSQASVSVKPADKEPIASAISNETAPATSSEEHTLSAGKGADTSSVSVRPAAAW